MRTLLVLPVFALLLASAPLSVQAAEVTDFMVSVRAKDGKFIGSAMGGAMIEVRDRRTGDILANGVAHGSSEGTEALTPDNSKRDAVLVGEDTANLQFSLELFEPVPVTISATGPLSLQESAFTVSQDMILLPGMDYTGGNGIMLELPGIVVDVTSPAIHTTMKHDADAPITVTANVLKTAGTRIEKGSAWPPERYQVEALIYKDAYFIMKAPVEYAGEAGVYKRVLKFPEPGTYRVIVTVFDPVTKEAGMDETTMILTK